VQIPSGCVRVGDSAFLGSGLKRVAIPDYCEVGKAAFEMCRSLTTVTIGIGCTMIGNDAFCRCSALTTATLPPTLWWIGRGAFAGCPALATLAIPKKCQVHKHAFKGSMTSVMEL
jgi:hypothetical protein